MRSKFKTREEIFFLLQKDLNHGFLELTANVVPISKLIPSCSPVLRVTLYSWKNIFSKVLLNFKIIILYYIDFSFIFLDTYFIWETGESGSMYM